MEKNIQKMTRKILLLLLSVIITLLLMEGLIRLVSPHQTSSIEFTHHPVLGDIPIPNQKGFVNTPRTKNYYTYQNNSLGMRGLEYSFEKSKPRILTLGNSFTYGQEVNDNETFSSVLQKQSTAYEVINGGNPGKGPDYQLTFFDYLGYKFQPDIVFLFSHKGDFACAERQIYYGLSDDGKLVKKTPENTVGSRKEFLQHLPFYPWLMENSQLANLLKHTAISLLLRRGGNEDLVIDNGANLNLTESIIAVTSELLNALKNTIEEHNSKLVIFYMPDWRDVEEFREKKEPSLSEKTMAQIAADNNIDFVSLTPPFAQTNYDLKDLYVAGKGHLTVTGNEIVGLYLSEYINRSESWLLK